MGGEVCGLRGRASPLTQAEGGRLALQVPSPERTHLAVPVAWEAVALCAASATVVALMAAAAARPAVTTVT